MPSDTGDQVEVSGSTYFDFLYTMMHSSELSRAEYLHHYDVHVCHVNSAMYCPV